MMLEISGQMKFNRLVNLGGFLLNYANNLFVELVGRKLETEFKAGDGLI